MNKKGNALATLGIFLLVLIVGGGIGYMTDWFGFVEPAEAQVAEGSEGELGTLKYSTESVTANTPLQFAGTGYCWDVTTPTQLIESRNGKTLSASAGTTYSPAYRGSTYECTAFGTGYQCAGESGKMVNEGLELRSECYNVTRTALDITFYDDGSGEAENSSAVGGHTNTLTLGNGKSDSYGKWILEVNNSDTSYVIGAVCWGTNNSNSQVKKITFSGMTNDVVPSFMPSNADDQCYKLSSPVTLEEWDTEEFGTIVFEAEDTWSATNDELIMVVLMDQCQYVASDGAVKSDWFERETSSQNDCGQGMYNTTILLS